MTCGVLLQKRAKGCSFSMPSLQTQPAPLEKFVVMMYDRSAQPYEAIPPTRSVLKQHVKRSAYQAGCIWSQSTVH